MKCKCIEKIEKQMIGRKLTNGKTIVDARLSQVGHVGVKMEQITFTDVEYRTEHGQVKTKKIPFFHSFCPFCGKKITDDKK